MCTVKVKIYINIQYSYLATSKLHFYHQLSHLAIAIATYNIVNLLIIQSTWDKWSYGRKYLVSKFENDHLGQM